MAQAKTPPLERALGALGGIVALALIGYFALAALRGDGRGQPEVRVELEAPARIGPGWVVPFRAVNDGRSPASQILLEAELALPGGGSERSEVAIDHLAGRSEQAGGFYFRQDPASGRLTARALGFLEP